MSTKKFNTRSGVTAGLEWYMATLPKQGEKKCGDTFFVEKHGDNVLAAAIDGLGHGVSAARASTRAKYLIKECNNKSLINIINYCHQNLRSTRGVVMSLALIDFREQTLTWIGVGNVQGFLLPEDRSDWESIILRHGIVGYNLTSLQASVIPISMGDILMFTTDGVKNNFINNLNGKGEPKEIVEYIASNYFKRSDDSLVLAARVIGEENNEET